ncbi:MAG TPA: FtsH protease activity modulator HflK [Anaerolineales bacterium]|nr:FtsH protease activity modulator HflK [Anaerolineales bacterium]
MTTETPNPPPIPEPGPTVDWLAVLRRIARTMGAGLRFLIGEGESPLADLRAAIGNLSPRRILWGLIALVALVYLGSGLYVVAPGEAAVVRRFGAVVEPRAGPGLHYRFPWPVDRVDIVNVSQVRRETVGLLEPEEDHEHPEPPSKLQALSGDTNVIDIEIIVQYQVRDPAAYIVNVRYAPYRLVRDVVREAVTSRITTLPVDGILTTERQSLQEAIRAEAQARLDTYNSGLVIVGVNLQKAFPPDEVAGAFIDVNSAREDKARAINEATGYANSIIPQARGQAEQILAQGQAYRSNALGQANGAAQAFESVLGEYQANSAIYGEDVTRYRLYLETLEKILPRAQVYVVDVTDGSTVSLRLFGNAVLTPTPAP